jgi:hypothetical protein
MILKGIRIPKGDPPPPPLIYPSSSLTMFLLTGDIFSSVISTSYEALSSPSSDAPLSPPSHGDGIFFGFIQSPPSITHAFHTDKPTIVFYVCFLSGFCFLFIYFFFK